MLILSRRPGEDIRIGEDIIITVLGTKGTQVRIGVTAPKHVSIDRAEIALKKKAEKENGSPKDVGKAP